jgi:hypothetical protein
MWSFVFGKAPFSHWWIRIHLTEPGGTSCHCMQAMVHELQPMQRL